MAINQTEYQALRKLRDALAALPILAKGYNDAKANEEAHQKTLSAAQTYIQNPPPFQINTYKTKLLEEFRKDAKESDRRATKRAEASENKRCLFLTVLRMTLLILATLIVLGVTAFLTYICAKWSWNSSITSLMGYDDLPYKTSVGVHLFALSIVLTIFAFIFLVISKIFDEYIILTIPMLLFWVAAVVALIASFPYYYSDMGFWEGLFMGTIGAIFLIPIALLSILKIFVFVLALCVALCGTGGMIYLCCFIQGEYPISRRYVGRVNTALRALDETPLRQSEIFKEATKLDEEIASEKSAAELERQKGIVCSEQKYVMIYSKQKEDYLKDWRKCKQVIDSSTFLNKAYHTVRQIDTILYYFDYNRADTIKEALNLYVQDQQHMQIINKLDQIRKEQLQAMNRAVKQITTKLDQMENTFCSELDAIRSATEAQTAAIRSEAEKSRVQQEKLAQEREKATQRRAEQFDARLSQIAWNQTLQNEILRKF